MTTTPFTTVLIVNWNAGEYLLRCVQSIPEEYPIIIVDNNSKDGSIETVKSFFPGVKVIKSPVNLGYSAGNNLGISEVATKYVLFLNPDTEIIGDAIALMENFLEKHPAYAAVGPRIIERDGQINILSGRRHFNLWIGIFEAFLLDKIFFRNKWFNYRMIPEWDRLSSRDVDCLCGCAMLMQTDIVKQLDGFDESVPLYLDDNDICRKITESESKIHCLVEANILHIHKISSQQAPATWIIHLNLKACYVYLIKYHSHIAASIYLISLLVGSIARIAMFFVGSFFDKKYRLNLRTSYDVLKFTLFNWYSKTLEKCPD